MYSSTTSDWKTLKKTERTERPSRLLRLRQNCTSVGGGESIGESVRFAHIFYIPFLKARNSKIVWRMLTAMVKPSRYGLVSCKVV